MSQIAWRGQYDSYAAEVGRPKSTVETYAAVRLLVDNPRWQGVPFVLQTGKAMAAKETKIEVFFGSKPPEQNILTLHLQPEESVELDVSIKAPGYGHEQVKTTMQFSYKQRFAGRPAPDAYERVLLDAMNADNSLFATSKEVLAAWQIVQPILDEWAKNSQGLRFYPKGADASTIFPQ